ERYTQWKPVDSADFDQNYEPISPSYPAAVPGRYIVQSGDSLRSIAQQLWGDADAWVYLADANGLSGSEPLSPGQVLEVPNQVTNLHHRSDTWRPYNPGEAEGNVSPSLPPSVNREPCGGAGPILVIAVIIIVTILSQGRLTPWAVQTFGPMIGPTAAGAIGTGLSAAAGAAAGQATANAIGMTNKFDWKAVAMAGITAGVSKYV
ncbi:LysM peptidoglycan-binding domain-containing protein, partial [Parachitinimonas caeni]